MATTGNIILELAPQTVVSAQVFLGAEGQQLRLTPQTGGLGKLASVAVRDATPLDPTPDVDLALLYQIAKL